MSNATFTHEVVIDGEVAFTTELPQGMDPKLYDRIATKMRSHVAQEATGGRAGAEDRLELAISLKASCPELRDKSWKQLVQEDAYRDQVSAINAEHGKAKSAYSNHLLELREDKERLGEFIGQLDVVKDKQLDVDSLVAEWWLDPNREKKHQRKATGTVTIVNTPGFPKEDSDEDEYDDAPGYSVRGLVGAVARRLRGIQTGDLGNNPSEFLNELADLARATERAKAFTVNALRR